MVVPHHHPARIARQAPGRFRGNARAVLEDRLAGLIRVREHRGIDMDDDLVALARRAGIEPVMQRSFREQRQRIRLLLSDGGAILDADLPAHRLAGGFQRPHDQRPHFGCQPAPQHDHTVLILIHVECAALVPPRVRVRLGLAVHAAPAPHDALDVLGRAGPPHGQQPLFRLRRRHAGQGANFRVGQLSAGEGTAEEGQRSERARHSDLLPCRPDVEAHAPAQPGGAGAEPIAPAGARVELTDEVEEPGSGRFEVRGQLGDLVSEA
ncbi:MAG TPA: hypothetical protein VMR23_05680 [Candidatus Limnocylindria bacterium]|nr:hypothetical protein [Candidatus Limnocylindria bacterium]